MQNTTWNKVEVHQHTYLTKSLQWLTASAKLTVLRWRGFLSQLGYLCSFRRCNDLWKCSALFHSSIFQEHNVCFLSSLPWTAWRSRAYREIHDIVFYPLRKFAWCGRTHTTHTQYVHIIQWLQPAGATATTAAAAMTLDIFKTHKILFIRFDKQQPLFMLCACLFMLILSCSTSSVFNVIAKYLPIRSII